jgi:upstream activation factor subunit UAF30
VTRKHIYRTRVKNIVLYSRIIMQNARTANAIITDLNLLIDQLVQSVETMKVNISHARTIRRQAKKTLTNMERSLNKKTKNKNPNNRTRSGINKEAKVSTELCEFLNVIPGTLMARTTVTTKINKYIKDNQLQNPDNKRRIVPNAQLRELLKIAEGEELTFFDLPRCMNHHFIKD